MFLLKPKEELPAKVNMVDGGIVIGKFPVRHVLDLFEPDSVLKGVKFKNRVPIVSTYPDCFSVEPDAEEEPQIEVVD